MLLLSLFVNILIRNIIFHERIFLIQIKLNDTIDRSSIFECLRDIRNIVDGLSIFFKGKLDIRIIYLAQLKQILCNIGHFGLALDLKYNLFHSFG